MIEQSYGVIPFYEGENGREVFLIHQYGSSGDTLWTFPKGRPEQGETPYETALRECKEETGMTPAKTFEESPVHVSYTFARNGKQVEKTSTYYVSIMNEKAFTIQPEEVKEAGWFSIRDAREQITFPDYKKLLDDALSILDNSL
jgi:bis(5'-nucleosidyl)-tetraphosphatase